MEDFSEGQKKKVLIASSLITKAHIYIWDEPLNYIDVFSRMQIEKLINNNNLTMLIVEHDVKFREKIATKIIDLDRNGNKNENRNERKIINKRYHILNKLLKHNRYSY